ncbi:helix-turn-helix domain-containing protein [Shewanella nanhaiensis]|uniref:Helix-turn-helix transcriptional regulator n=1 Tax=Shewanella nanhaiensis TaxID=2864872 RepID=A0ABS7E387_9GAMM|nr:helix-turn-helix transcriptional regulator [Shewanella nanhaiensis]MBW8184069.1 helix-turn-helix transcriptional regulator [Shewanella nanhaiensis]
MLDKKEINRCIVDIYRLAYEQPIENFKQAAMNRFSELIPIDMGFWITRSEMDTPYFDDDSFTYNLPNGVMKNYIEMVSASETAQTISRHLQTHLNKTFDVLEIIPNDIMESSDLYLLHCKKYDIEHAMVTMHANLNSQIFNAFSFCRNDRSVNFTQEEREIKQFFIPNFVEALRVNLISSVSKQGKDRYCLRGIVDKHGKIIESEERFEQFINELNIVNGNTLDIENLYNPTFLKKNKIQVSTQNFDGLIYVEINKLSIEESLSKRKKEVCKLLCEGLSNKEISNKMYISQDAVSNHLKEINKILNVTSRYQAIAVLLEPK